MGCSEPDLESGIDSGLRDAVLPKPETAKPEEEAGEVLYSRGGGDASSLQESRGCSTGC